MLTKEKPIEYTEAAYCAYCADAVFYADNESKPGLHVALTSIAITNETRKACFISFKLIPEFLFVIMRVSGVLLVESLSV